MDDMQRAAVSILHGYIIHSVIILYLSGRVLYFPNATEHCRFFMIIAHDCFQTVNSLLKFLLTMLRRWRFARLVNECNKLLLQYKFIIFILRK